MIALIFSLMLDYRIPVNYYFEEKKKIGISQPVNRKERRKRK